MSGTAPASAAPDRRRLGGLATAALAVVLWRAAALALRLGGESGAGEFAVAALLGLVGLVFVACGLFVYRRRPGPATLLFAAWALAAGLHWGGPLELAAGGVRTALLIVYLVLSSFLAETLFLHFALAFPRPLGLLRRRSTLALLYAPVSIAVILAALFLLAPAGSALAAASQQLLLGAHALVSNLFAVLALAIFVGRVARPTLPRRTRRYLALMVGGMLAAWVPYLAAPVLGVATDVSNLAMVVLPLAFAAGILGISRDGGEAA